MNPQADLPHNRENTSGTGPGAAVPDEINRWNWGAFLLTWIWGIGNGTFIALLMFVPFVNVVMAFVLGAKGSEWAWRNKRWESIEAFRATQRKWAWAGLAAMVLSGVLAVAIIVGSFAAIKQSEAYALSLEAVQSDQDAVEILGEPITAGTPVGVVRTSGSHGEAELQFHVEGPDAEGTVYTTAIKSQAGWKLDDAVLTTAKTGEQVNLTD